MGTRRAPSRGVRLSTLHAPERLSGRHRDEAAAGNVRLASRWRKEDMVHPIALHCPQLLSVAVVSSLMSYSIMPFNELSTDLSCY